jgi:transcriptional regulator with GAF, ATPase, and Fis domain
MVESDEDITTLRARLAEIEAENDYLRAELDARTSEDTIASDALAGFLASLNGVATTDAALLLIGDPRAAEFLARRIHEKSTRSGGRFVKVRCATTPWDVLEQRIALSRGGTIYLDRIGALTRDAQDKLVACLGDGKVAARVLASTDRDLRADIEGGRFNVSLHDRLAKDHFAVPSSGGTNGSDEIVSDSEWRKRERDNVIRALARADGKIYGNGGAAQLLGLKPSTLQSRLRALGINARQRPDS